MQDLYGKFYGGVELITYIIQLSQFGTVAYRADVTVDAKSEEEAVIKAEKMAEKGKIDFDDDLECVDGWEIQADNVEEIK